jgi:hypothetical protein
VRRWPPGGFAGHCLSVTELLGLGAPTDGPNHPAENQRVNRAQPMPLQPAAQHARDVCPPPSAPCRTRPQQRPADPGRGPAHIFEHVYRGRSARFSGEPGTGLGLAISKDIVERHQGWIEVESNAPAGTTLRLAAGFAAVTFRPGGRTWGPGPLALHAGRVHPLVSGFSSSLGGRQPPAFTDREPTSVGGHMSRAFTWAMLAAEPHSRFLYSVSSSFTPAEACATTCNPDPSGPSRPARPGRSG